MPAPKKKGRGNSGKGVAGRKKRRNRSEERDSSEEREYNRTKQAQHRGQVSMPKKKTQTNLSVSSPSASCSRSCPGTLSRPGLSLSTGSPSTQRRGRPPTAGSQADTPNTPRRKNTMSQQRSRHEAKTKKARSAASLKRWNKDTQSSTDVDCDFDLEPEGGEGQEVADPRRLIFDENLNQDGMEQDVNDNMPVMKSSRTKDEPYGKMSKSTYYDYLRKVKEVMEKNNRWQNYDVCLDLLQKPKFRRTLNQEKMELKLNNAKYHENYVRFANISEKTISRRAEKIMDRLKSCAEPEIIVEDALLGTILKDSFAISVLEECGLEIPDHLLTKVHFVSRTYSRVKDKIMGRRRGADHYLSMRATLETAQTCGLSADNHGDIGILKDVIGSSWQFANSILSALKNNTTDSLFQRGRRKDCIKLTPFPNLLSEWAKNPDNSRRVPGNETVSIGYRQRAPKIVLLKPRRVVIEEFLEANPTCHFTQRTLNREWPQNVRAATSRDLDRNVCGLHSNMRRMERALKKHLGSDIIIPSSCRLMASLVMCREGEIDPLEPTTWHEDCVKGRCSDCPAHETPVPADLRNVQVNVALWGNKRCPIKNKVINHLHDWQFTIGELADKFDKLLKKLKLHIYTAAHQWSSSKLSSDSVTPNTIVTIKDYQVFIARNIFHTFNQ